MPPEGSSSQFIRRDCAKQTQVIGHRSTNQGFPTGSKKIGSGVYMHPISQSSTSYKRGRRKRGLKTSGYKGDIGENARAAKERRRWKKVARPSKDGGERDLRR